MKINDLIKFLIEKEDSGEGISDAKDAAHLIEEMADIETKL